MPKGDGETTTIWLSVPEFSRVQTRPERTIYRWLASGFLVELGFLVRYDLGGKALIGIPCHNALYLDARSATIAATR